MSGKSLISDFIGPMTPPALTAWLNRCEDSFENYDEEKGPDKALSTAAKIRYAGTAMKEPSMMFWWDTNRDVLKALASWRLFADKVKERFMAKEWRLDSLSEFYAVRQLSGQPFKAFVAELEHHRGILGAAGTFGITDNVMKRHLLFYANKQLMLRILALQSLIFDTVTVDALIQLMSATWDSLLSEGTVRSTKVLVPTALASPVPSTAPAPAPVYAHHHPMSLVEMNAIKDARGCFRCKKTPSSPGWVRHQAKNCPGDSAQGITPGPEYVAVKTEMIAAVFPSYVPYDSDEDSDDVESDFDEFGLPPGTTVELPNGDILY